MSAFDPYHRWLGIAPKDQPPSHYRLLGIDDFEPDSDVIEAAAERQTVFLRTFQIGPQAELGERILNEILRAQVTLLNVDQKMAYDNKLRESLRSPANPTPPSDAATLSAEVDCLHKKLKQRDHELQERAELAHQQQRLEQEAASRKKEQDQQGAQEYDEAEFPTSTYPIDPHGYGIRRSPSGRLSGIRTSKSFLSRILPWSRSPSPAIVFVVVIGVLFILTLFLIFRKPRPIPVVSRLKEADISEPQVLPEAKPPATGDQPTVDQPEPVPPKVSTDEPDVAIAAFDVTEAKQHQQDWEDRLKTELAVSNSIGMQLRLIPPGEFMMGSPESEANRRPDETQHRVRITKPFYLSAHEVTQAQYNRVMGNNPSRSKGPTKPVEMVSWNDAVEFCRRLSEQERKEYRLPTEAEWEYACRVGTTTSYSCGDNVSQLGEYAWYSDNSGNASHAVGEKLPNAWGLYDMHGNVFEWCRDWRKPYGSQNVLIDPAGPASGSRRVLRGGSFSSLPRLVRSANRIYLQSDDRGFVFGFRLARTYNLSP